MNEVILIGSIGYNVGGDRKLFIWKESYVLLGVIEENKDEPVTVNDTKLPLQSMLLFTPKMLVQLIVGDIGKIACDKSLIQNL